MRITSKIFQILISIAVLTACGNSNELTWTEDVRLPDGRILTLKRWVEFKGGSSHLGDPSVESQQRLEFKHPVTGQLIKWQNHMAQGRLNTVALWLERDVPMLLTRPSYVGDKQKFNCPDPPYLLYEYLEGQWQNKPLAQIQIAKVRANLTTSPLEKREEIEQQEYQLTAEHTSDSYTYYKGVHKEPYVLKFEGMPVQTFEEKNCELGPNFTSLLVTQRQ